MDEYKKAQNSNQSPQDLTLAILYETLDQLHSKNRESALAKLKSLERNKVVEILGTTLKDSDPQRRTLAVDALMNIDLRGTLELTLPLLNDPDSEVRWTVCYWLCEDGDSRAIEPLINVLKSDSDVSVRIQAATALGASGDLRVKDALIWARDHDSEADIHGHSVKHIATIALQNLMKNNV
jgi:HEAT repeat protein